jgi:hypothetical protein
MDQLNQRFKQEGGNVYDTISISEQKLSQEGGGKSEKNYNWKKQYLLMKVDRDNLKKENEKLQKQIINFKKNKEK